MTNTIAESKFKMKGTAFLSLKKYCESQAMDLLFLELFKDLKVGYSRPLASAWYDAEDYLKLCHELARMADVRINQFVIIASEFTANNDLNGVYKAFMRVAGLKAVLSRLPMLASSYTSYLKAEVVNNEKGNYQIQFISPVAFYELTTWNFRGAVSAMLKTFNCEIISFDEIEKERFKDEEENCIRGIWQLVY